MLPGRPEKLLWTCARAAKSTLGEPGRWQDSGGINSGCASIHESAMSMRLRSSSAAFRRRSELNQVSLTPRVLKLSRSIEHGTMPNHCAIEVSTCAPAELVLTLRSSPMDQAIRAVSGVGAAVVSASRRSDSLKRGAVPSA
eukprot:7384401-Prymnesium_polylepis.3